MTKLAYDLRDDRPVATQQLRNELLDAGARESWDATGDDHDPGLLVVQVLEDAVVACEEPRLTEDGDIVMVGGLPVTDLVWRRPDAERAAVDVDPDLIPDDHGVGTWLHVGPGTLEIFVAPDTPKALVDKVLAKHVPAESEPDPRHVLADLLTDTSVPVEDRLAAMADHLRGGGA